MATKIGSKWWIKRQNSNLVDLLATIFQILLSIDSDQIQIKIINEG